MKKYNPDTDDVIFSIRKSSNGAYMLVEKIQFIHPRSHYISDNIYIDSDLQKEIQYRKELYLRCNPNFSWKFIIKTNWHVLP